SYEGTFTADGGPADGQTSVDINVFESSGTSIGHSLQLIGTGSVYTDFTWQAPAAASMGSVNSGQTFAADETPPVWTASYPTITNITAYSGDLTVNLDEAGTVYFMVLENEATAPTAEEVKAGVAYGTVTPLYPDNFKYVSANTDQVFVIRGAEAETDYDIYVVAGDNAGNLQSTPIKFDVTTTSTGIKITNPQPGETYAVGQEITFTWESVNVTNILIGGYDFIHQEHFLITADENGDPSPIDASLGTLTFEIPNDAPFDSLAIIMLDASNYALRDSVAPIYITDNVNPGIDELYPANNETDVSASYIPYIYFVEPVFPFTGKIYIKEESGTLFEEFDINGSGPGEQLEFTDDQYGIKITPTSPFLAGTSYYIEIDAGVVLDYFGNPFDGIYGSSTWFFTIAGTSAIEDELTNNIKLFPVPASTILTVSYEGGVRQLEILDLTGSRVYLSEQLNNAEHKIDVSSLPKGIYFIKISTDNKLLTRKFIKK
ncbi:MAG: T9SS type A sorting domain-containing protein, partial [Marinilabiliaceae bacterium]|nr:T9SS type A sorting domain-containing protein [Marinilabiliaceae bacterium]